MAAKKGSVGTENKTSVQKQQSNKCHVVSGFKHQHLFKTYNFYLGTQK